jgi:hypothetical protein
VQHDTHGKFQDGLSIFVKKLLNFPESHLNVFIQPVVLCLSKQ